MKDLKCILRLCRTDYPIAAVLAYLDQRAKGVPPAGAYVITKLGLASYENQQETPK